MVTWVDGVAMRPRDDLIGLMLDYIQINKGSLMSIRLNEKTKNSLIIIINGRISELDSQIKEIREDFSVHWMTRDKVVSELLRLKEDNLEILARLSGTEANQMFH